MEKIVRTPDQKMRAGAIIGIVTSAITAVWAVVMVILVFTATSLLFKNIPDETHSVTLSFVTVVKVAAVISALISLVVSGIIIWLCRNVLSGKAKNGLAAGITILVLSALGLIGFFVAISGVAVVTLLISLAGIAGGILLIMGKYETNSSKEIIVEPITETQETEVK